MIKYELQDFFEEFQASNFEKKTIREFMKKAEEEKVDRKEVLQALVLLELAVRTFL